MINYPKVYLGKGRDKSVLRRHPWVFSGAIASSERDLKEGELVQVVGHDERFLGIGHCCSGSLAIKVLTFEEEVVNQQNPSVLEIQPIRHDWSSFETL